jgi:hypothetical protein
MIVVLDSNIWISQLGLNSTVGTAVRFFIKERKARIALPEVIRLETEHHLRDNLNGYISGIMESHRELLTVFGHLKEVILPNSDEVEKKVAELFVNTGLEIIDIPFSKESARDSFIRTVRKGQQGAKALEFADGMIWADCIELLKQDDVTLVTQDKAFFQGRDSSRGLSSVLAKEAEQAKHSFKLVASLEELLEDIRVEITLDERLLESSFYEQYKESIGQILSKKGFEAQGEPKIERKLFATESPVRVFLSFTITYECIDVTEEGRFGGVLSVRGDGFYNREAGSFEQLKSFGEELRFRLKDGSEQQFRNVVVRVAGITMGHKEVTHTVRYELE